MNKWSVIYRYQSQLLRQQLTTLLVQQIACVKTARKDEREEIIKQIMIVVIATVHTAITMIRERGEELILTGAAAVIVVIVTAVAIVVIVTAVVIVVVVMIVVNVIAVEIAAVVTAVVAVTNFRKLLSLVQYHRIIKKI